MQYISDGVQGSYRIYKMIIRQYRGNKPPHYHDHYNPDQMADDEFRQKTQKADPMKYKSRMYHPADRHIKCQPECIIQIFPHRYIHSIALPQEQRANGEYSGQNETPLDLIGFVHGTNVFK